ncbi:DNA/RNA non-specific endonuclease [Lactococcus insecticola]|uniref:Type VII secretion system protein EssD-like domain-containing protein n=1 Tax=Pseudolactococcus insecticola TaxID=2709158 RepID=A0A6A0B579_9LACT|nr:DNA/RNA non-specific endonuclease [Lactococcus insecticola]GFH40540.1 hypothetical protein Hs20B_09380 [Lactococcus insecticola]
MKNKNTGTLIAIIILVVSLTTAGLIGLATYQRSDSTSHTSRQKTTSKTTISQTASNREKASTTERSSKQAQSSTAPSKLPKSEGTSSDSTLTGAALTILPYQSGRQLILGNLDAMKRPTDAHIQLSNSDEPTAKNSGRLTVDPPGWHNYKFWYTAANGETKQAWLMNRTHLVGYQFSGLHDEPRNLVTGTSYVNTGAPSGMDAGNEKGMLYYENQLDSWLALHPSYHLDYQVTPFYRGDELLPRQIRLSYIGYDSHGKTQEIHLNSSLEHTTAQGITYVFLDNVAENAVIDYRTGTAKNLVTENKTAPSATSEPLTVPSETSAKQTDGTSKTKIYEDATGKGLIKGSQNGIYHLPGDRYYDKTTNPKAWFKTIAEAENAGYRAPK